MTHKAGKKTKRRQQRTTPEVTRTVCKTQMDGIPPNVLIRLRFLWLGVFKPCYFVPTHTQTGLIYVSRCRGVYIIRMFYLFITLRKHECKNRYNIDCSWHSINKLIMFNKLRILCELLCVFFQPKTRLHWRCPWQRGIEHSFTISAYLGRNPQVAV